MARKTMPTSEIMALGREIPVPGIPAKAKARIVVQDLGHGSDPRLALLANANGVIYTARYDTRYFAGAEQSFVLGRNRKFFVQRQKGDEFVDVAIGSYESGGNGQVLKMIPLQS